MNFYELIIGYDYLNEVPQLLVALDMQEEYQAFLNAPELDQLSGDPEALMDYLDLVLVHGNLSEEAKANILVVLNQVVFEPDFVKRFALYLTMMSPDYAIMR